MSNASANNIPQAPGRRRMPPVPACYHCGATAREVFLWHHITAPGAEVLYYCADGVACSGAERQS
jgi:hypothetical protein